MRSEVGKILEQQQVTKLCFGNNDSPQKILGRHFVKNGQVISVYIPYAIKVGINLDDEYYELENIEKTNIFAVYVPHKKQIPYTVWVELEDGTVLEKKDPYSFELQLTDAQLQAWEDGTWKDVYRYLGAHKMVLNGVAGIHFAVWAPNAVRVSIVGDFNDWDGRLHPMVRREKSGIFELFLPDAEEGMRYKYEIKTMLGDVFLKADPFANAFEVTPGNASVITDFGDYVWNDRMWMIQRKEEDVYSGPFSIYEVHLGSWKRTGVHGEQYLDYRELAHQIADYTVEMGYTHVELLGVLEHLKDRTIGHEIYGYYAPTSRFGNIRDFQYFIDYLHQRGIGVILDWAPAGISKDPSGITRFDGSPLFESEDVGKIKIMHWNTAPFDYTKNQVSNYIISNGRFWMREFHIDGFRIASQDCIIYEDISKKNHEGRVFLKNFIDMVNNEHSGCVVITENMPHSLCKDLNTNFRWASYYVDSLIEKIKKSNEYQQNSKLTDMNTLNQEHKGQHSIIKMSHRFGDRAGSMVAKMPGDYFAKFANLRTVCGFLIGMRGKKHLFMGQDIGQWSDWNVNQSIDWHVLHEESNRKYQRFIKDLLHFYKKHPVLYTTDYKEDAIEWHLKEKAKEVIVYGRKDEETGEELLFVCNFTPMNYESYSIGLPNYNHYRQVFSSDEKIYGGLGSLKNEELVTKESKNGENPYILSLRVPMQSIVILEKIKQD